MAGCALGILVVLLQGIIISSATATDSDSSSPVVHLGDNASLRGLVTHTHESTKPVYTFTGVPFAEPPVRFLPAETLKLWDGEKDATKIGNICIQNTVMWKMLDPTFDTSMLTTSEDCLLLNIFTPSLDTNSKLAVMVWIHGGGFSMGAGAGYEGTALASFHDVVYVAINYRVAGLGFLTTGDSNAPGNIALHDQLEALRWVQRYIHKFGGDPQEVTIFGESAGGFSVSFHLVSPLSKDLFKRAISQSGVAVYSADHTTEKSIVAGLPKTKQIAKREGCPTDDNKSMVECLRGKPAESFINMEDVFLPLIDGHFMPDSPYNLYSTGQVNAKDYMLGAVVHEGYMLTAFLPMIAAAFGYEAIDMSNLTPDSARAAMKIWTALDLGDNPELVDVCMKHYIGDKDKHEDVYRGMVEFYGDFLMDQRILDTARKHSVKKSTFVYLFNHRIGLVGNRPDWVVSDHGDDVLPALGNPFFKPIMKLPFMEGRTNFSEEDRTVSKLMMSYWTNFAKTGDPNGEGLPRWPTYDCQAKKLLTLSTNPEEVADYKSDLMKMWADEIPKLDKSKTYKGFPWKCPAEEKVEL